MLSQKEINQRISEVISSDDIKTVYNAIGQNLNGNLLHIMQMAAVHGVTSEFKTFNQWYELGQYIKKGQKAYTVVDHDDSLKMFSSEQLQKANGYGRKNKRTMQSLLDALNRMTVLKSTSDKTDFDAVAAAVRHYIEENNTLAEYGIEPTVYSINPLAEGVSSIEVGSEEFRKHFPHLTNGKEIYVERSGDGWYVETILGGERLINAIKEEIAKIDSAFIDQYATVTNAIAGVIAYSTCDFTGEGFTPVGLPYSYLENAQIIRDVVFPCAKEVAAHIESEEVRQEEEKKERAAQKPIITHESTGEQTNIFDIPKHIVQNVAASIEEKKSSAKALFDSYNEVQEQHHGDVVLYRIGDFFEILGDNAKKVAELADITLLSRDIDGTSVPMCGVPYHAVKQYVDKITQTSGVIIAEPDKEPIRIKSMAELYPPIENGLKAKVYTEEEAAAIMENALKKHIKEWYGLAYPSDDAVEDINADATFKDLNVALNNGEDVYEVLGISDSVIRERAFQHLAENILLESTSHIYDLWHKADTLAALKAESESRTVPAVEVVAEELLRINFFKQLTDSEREVFDRFQQRPMSEPTDSLWDEVENCTTIANGIYEVDTAGHGGIMVHAGLAPCILSSQALAKGERYGHYYCFEEDCNAAIALRELWDKGILDSKNDYFRHYNVETDSLEAVMPSVPFTQATKSEKEKFFQSWNETINTSLKTWNPNYWAAYQGAEVVSQPIAADSLMVDAALVNDALEPHPFYNNSQTFTSITVNGAEADLAELSDRLLGQGYSIHHIKDGLVFDMADEDMEALEELIGNNNLTYHPTEKPLAYAKEPKVIIEWSENAILDAFAGKELTLGFADKLISDVYNSREVIERYAEGGYDKTKFRLLFDERVAPLFRDSSKREFMSLSPNTPEEEIAKYYIPGEFVNRIDSDERCGIIGQIEDMYSRVDEADIPNDIKAEYIQVKESLLPYLKAEAELTRDVIEVTPDYVKQLLSQDAIKVHSYTPANYVDANGELCGLYEHTLEDGTPYIFIAPTSKFNPNNATLDNSGRDIKYVTTNAYLINWLDDSTNYHFEQNLDYRQQSELVEYQYINQVTLDNYRQIEELTFNEQPFKPYAVTPTALPTNASEAQKDVEGVIETTNTATTIEGFGGKVARCTDNLAAIRLLKVLEAENRTPNADERQTLSNYVGWGGIPEIFDENNTGWESRRNELKALLTEQQYNDARASVVNSFFTADLLVQKIYAGIERMGIREGGTSKGKIKVLEPSMGMGAFLHMPPYLAVNDSFTGVELDEITAKIAKKLHPLANIINSGFQDTSFKDGEFDLVVGNVPFGEYGVYDKNFNNDFKIHDYFVAKSIQKVHEGGLVAVITSSGTMDKLDSSARKYIADRAELVGAIRLPNSAFKNANADVMTDILFLRKRENQIDSSDEYWVGTSEFEETGLRINNYFLAHPEMVMGHLTVRSSQYGPKIGVADGELSLNDALTRAINHLPENIFVPKAQETANTVEVKTIPLAGHEDIKNYCYEVIDGVLYQRHDDVLVDSTFTGKGAKQNFERAAAMIEMRKQVRNILNLQLASCSEVELYKAQKVLSELYDKFVPKYGNINNAANTRCFGDDADWALLSTIEQITGEQEVNGKPVKIYGKSDIFTKRTIRPYVEITHCDNLRDALQVCKNNKNVVDIPYIANLVGSQPDEVISGLGNLIYRNPEAVIATDKYSGYETAEEYLSGDVKAKLAAAEHAAALDAFYKPNVDALAPVQPENITADKIGVSLGSRWIDLEIYQQFAEHILGLSQAHRDAQEYRYGGFKFIDLQYEGLTDEFGLSAAWPYNENTNATTTYGTKRMPAAKILETTLNLRPVTVYDTVEENGKKRRVINKEETLIAREKAQRIAEEFKEWIFADYDRRTYLEQKYNRLFNRIVLRQYDGEHLEFPGMNPEIKLNAHQKAAIYRSLCQGGSLMHHPVGAGKTFTMCGTIMKLKEYGLAKKPLVAVPNAIIEQFAGDFRRLYPNANLLVATEADFDKPNRKKFTAKVATGDWDAVIMAQSSFNLIKVNKERELRLRQGELDKIEETLAAYSYSRGKRVSVRRLEQLKKQKEKEIKELTDSTKFDDLINFEDLGVDYLFIDEAHNYKNKFFFTKMTNVAGLNQSSNAKKASYLDFKIDYINELHGGDKGVVFATGTPISNSMTEMYTMQSYLQRNKMKQLGFSTFDAWASTFGETVNSLELAPSGNGYRMKTRFAKFTNLPELLTLYNDFADVKEIGELGLKLPTVARQTVAIKPGADTGMVMEQISDRAERIYRGGVDPSVDNMLKITSDGKKTALDVRLIDPELSDGENNKISVAANNIARIYHATTENKSTQIVFCDISTPTPNAFESYVPGKDFNVYCELKQKLIELGVNPDEVQFVHDYEKDRKSLFRAVNDGRVRVLIGSTQKCGVGANCQERLVALHHLDTPYRPADLEQREGRIVRQGNTNENVEIYTYVTERTFDAYSYQILESKQRFISQIGHVDASIREIEDIDEKTLSYAEVKALTAANPLIKRKFELETRLADLRTLKAAYKQELYKTEKDVKEDLPWKIKYYTGVAEKAAKDVELYNANKTEDYIITINGETCKRSEETAEKFAKAMEGARDNVPFARFAGFDIVKLPIENLQDPIKLALVGTMQHPFKVTETAMGTLNRIKNVAENGIEEMRSEAAATAASAAQSLEQAKVLLDRGFEHEEEMQAMQKELIQIDIQLNLDKQDIVVESDSDAGEGGSDEQYLKLPGANYGQNLRPSAFSITYGGEDTRYFENVAGVSFKELCEKYMSSSKPYVTLQEYGKRIDAGRFAEIEQSGNVDYTAQFDIYTGKVSYMLEGEFVENEPVRQTLALLTGAQLSVQRQNTAEPRIYEYTVEKLARENDRATLAAAVAHREPGEGETPNPNFVDAFKEYDTYILKRTLDHYYRYRTDEGYQVRDILETPKGRKVALVEAEEGNFIGAIDYNDRTSEWEQGHYDLGDLNDAYVWFYNNFAAPGINDTPAVLPDYTDTEEDMHEYGYNYDGLLPIEQPTAIQLQEMGFDVFRLYEDGGEGLVEPSDYIGDDILYGVEKRRWQKFIDSEEGHNYLKARLSVLEATWQSQGDAASEKLRNVLWNELSATTAFMNELYERGITFDAANYQKYLPGVMANMIATVRNEREHKILDGEIADEILISLDGDVKKAYDDEIAYRNKLHEFIDEGLREFKFLDGKVDMIVGQDADDLTAWLKEHFEGSEYAGGAEGEDFDEWYDTFAEEVVKPYVENKIYAKNYYLCGYHSNNGPHVTTSTAYSAFDKLDEAIEAAKEFKANNSHFEKVEVREYLYPAKLSPHTFSYNYQNELQESSTLAWSTQLEDMLEIEDIMNEVKPELIGRNANYAGRNIANYYMPGELTEERLNAIVESDTIATEFAIFADTCNLPKDVLKASNAKFVQLNVDITPNEVDRLIRRQFRVDAPTINMPAIVDELFDIVERMPKNTKEEVEQRIKREYQAFKDNLVKQPGAAVYNEYYKIHFYEELYQYLIHTEDLRFDHDDWETLNGVQGGILNDMYQDFLGSEYAGIGNSEEVEDFLRGYINDLKDNQYFALPNVSENQNDFKQTPLYNKTAQAAFANNEVELYRNSNRANRACLESLREAVNANYKDNHLDTGAFLPQLVAEYGAERVSYVLAMLVRNCEGDARIARDNFAWAATVEISEDEQVLRSMQTPVHQAVLDSIVRTYRRELQAANTKEIPAISTPEAHEQQQGALNGFDMSATYYDVWWTQMTGSDIRKYYADFYSFDENGIIARQNQYFADISEEEVDSIINERQDGKKYIKLDADSLAKLQALRNEQQDRKVQTKRDLELQKALETPQTVSEEKLYELTQELETDMKNGAIDDDEYNHRKTILSTMRVLKATPDEYYAAGERAAEPQILSPVRQQFVEQIKSVLASGDLHYLQNLIDNQPISGQTGHAYRGINNLILSFTATEKGYTDPRWFTFSQIQKNNWTIKKGTKGTAVEMCELIDKTTKKPFDSKSIANLSEEERTAYWNENVYPVYKKHIVFNASCIEGIGKYVKPAVDVEERNARCEKILKSSGTAIKNDSTDKSYYKRTTDTIHLPKRETFGSIEDYYAVALHELGHSTGAPGRLNRITGVYGSQKYAEEELCAEFASILVQQELSLPLSSENVKFHTEYLKQWLNVLNNDPAILFKSITQADKICQYVKQLETNPAAAKKFAGNVRNRQSMQTRGKTNNFLGLPKKQTPSNAQNSKNKGMQF